MSENYRGDVRNMLIRRGWQVDEELVMLLRKGDAEWGAHNPSGDSTLGRDGWTVGFDNLTPARVIVAACEAAAS